MGSCWWLNLLLFFMNNPWTSRVYRVYQLRRKRNPRRNWRKRRLEMEMQGILADDPKQNCWFLGISWWYLWDLYDGILLAWLMVISGDLLVILVAFDNRKVWDKVWFTVYGNSFGILWAINKQFLEYGCIIKCSVRKCGSPKMTDY